jgi:hypothetical protein
MEYGDYDENQLMSYIQAQALEVSRDSKLGTYLCTYTFVFEIRINIRIHICRE